MHRVGLRAHVHGRHHPSPWIHPQYQLPPLLVVVCHDRATAAWAARHVDIGPSQWPTLTLRPLVLGPDNVPVVTTPD